MTIQEFIISNNMKMTYEYADSNPSMKDWSNADHYKIVLRFQRKRLTLYYSQGYGIGHDPRVEDVLECLHSDYSYRETSFEEYCSELGENPNSIGALKRFKAVQRQTIAFSRLMGDKMESLAIR